MSTHMYSHGRICVNASVVCLSMCNVQTLDLFTDFSWKSAKIVVMRAFIWCPYI